MFDWFFLGLYGVTDCVCVWNCDDEQWEDIVQIDVGLARVEYENCFKGEFYFEMRWFFDDILFLLSVFIILTVFYNNNNSKTILIFSLF